MIKYGKDVRYSTLDASTHDKVTHKAVAVEKLYGVEKALLDHAYRGELEELKTALDCGVNKNAKDWVSEWCRC